MFKYYDALLNRSGDALAGHFVRLFDAAGNQIDIYADESETPIISESGVANAAKSDSDGMVRFFVPSGDYDIRLYDASDTFLAAERAVPMVRGVTSAELLEDTTAASIGEVNEGNVQAALDAANTAIGERATIAALASSSGGEMVGFQQDGTATTVRRLNGKLGEFVSVADYLPAGYVTDGSVDYTSEIQACINENRLVKFPRGTFRHARLILKFEGQIIRGDGIGATVLYCPSGYAFTNFSGDDDDPIGADWIGGPTFEHLTLRGGFTHTDDFSPPANSWSFATGRSKPITTSAINAGLRLKRCYPYTLSDVVIENFHRGVFASGAALARWSNFLVRDCELGMHGETGAVWGDPGWQITTHRWSNGRFQNCWIGIYGSDFVQCSVDKKTVDFEPCNTGIAVTNGGDNVWSGYFELCCEGIYRNGSFMGHDIIEDPFFGGSPGAMWGDGDSILLDNGIGAGGKVTLRNGQGVIGGGGVRVLGGKLYRSEANGKALVFLSPALTPAPSYVPSDIQWALADGYDDIDVFDAGDPELFTIPAALDGATIVLRACLRISGDATPNDVSIEMRKNGAGFPGMGEFAEAFDYSRTVNIASAPVRVATGDVFKVVVLMNLARELPTGNRSWLAVEVVG